MSYICVHVIKLHRYFISQYIPAILISAGRNLYCTVIGYTSGIVWTLTRPNSDKSMSTAALCVIAVITELGMN